MRAGGTRSSTPAQGFISKAVCSVSASPPSRSTWLSAFLGTHPSSLSPHPNSGGLGPTEQFARAQREETLGLCNSRRGKGAWRPQKGRTVGGFINHHPSLLEGGRAVCFQNTSCWVLPLLNGEMRCQAPVPYRGENFHTPF